MGNMRARSRDMGEATTRRQVYRLPRERRVADIMEAAKLVFAKKGYDAALISEIAELAGVVEGTIYRYFENKRDLLIKVIERWYEQMLSEEDEQLAGIRGTWNRLRYVIWQHLKSIHEEPALSRLVFMELRPDPNYRSSAVFELNRNYTRRATEIVRSAAAQGEFRADVSLQLVRDMIYGCVEHHTWAYLRGEGDFPVDATADAITDIIYRGLAVSPAGKEGIGGVVARLEGVADRLARLAEAGPKPRKG
jgi:TetR/AcrR family fatty acid metabolism transcriptional regulator